MMKNKKLFLFCAFSFLFFPFLFCGCATTHSISGYKNGITVDGAAYLSMKALAEEYDFAYYWDPVTKKATLRKGGKEVSLIANSDTVLVGETVCSMGREARFYHGVLVVPCVFAQKTLIPFFQEKYDRKDFQQGLLGIHSVIIDPGHGGKDPGAIGKGGLKEKDIVFDISRRLKDKLQKRGIKTVLTREKDEFIALTRRSQIANSSNMDFLISIHANAARSRWVSGVEVFYLSESVDDAQRSFKAANDCELDIEEEYLGRHTSAILWDLKYAENRKESIALARFVCNALSKDLSLNNRGNKEARFCVLKTNIPAILIEVGFLSNPKEEKLLRQASYRDEIAEGIVRGIIEYNQNFSHNCILRK